MFRKLLFLALIIFIFFQGRYLIAQKLGKTSAIPQTVSLLLIGDIMLGRSVEGTALALKDNHYPFLKVAPDLQQADIVFANLENPVFPLCPKTSEGFIFCANPEMVEGLVFAGIDIVNLANNHTFNYGQRGFEETKKILTANQIKWVGDNNLEIIVKGGTRFGFLGFDFVSREPKKSDFLLVRNSASMVDELIVGIHWGEEYQPKANKRQERIARQLIENGVDVIAGHHPHWVQNSEVILGKPIYYSLGNFVFDQAWSEETKKGLVIKLTYQNSQLISQKEMPVYLENFAQPRWVE